MDGFRFWEMVSNSRRIITKPFESTLELKDEGGLSHAVKYISIAILISIIIPVLIIFFEAMMGNAIAGIVLLLIRFFMGIVDVLVLIAIIIVEPIKTLVFTFVFQRLSGLQGSTAIFRELVYSFALFWAPWVIFEIFLGIVLGHIIPHGDINNVVQFNNTMQSRNLILLLIKAVIMYYYFSRIGMAVTKLPHRKIVFPTVSSIALLLFLEKAILFLISSRFRIMSAFSQIFS